MGTFNRSAQDLLDALIVPGMSADGRALAVEAARIKMRLDQLDQVINGESEIFHCVDDGVEIIIKVDSALSEARQLATVFRQTVEAVKRGWPADGERDEQDDLQGL